MCRLQVDGLNIVYKYYLWINTDTLRADMDDGSCRGGADEYKEK